MERGFAEGNIKEEKVFGDAVFPKTLLPWGTSKSSARDLAETVERERPSLSRTLQSHGAILFRGFQVRSADEFDRVVRAFGWEDIPYVGAAERVSVTDRVYTANEVPLDVFINFHHEMAFARQSPSKIFFFCSEPSPEGGETSIVPSQVVAEKMEERLPEVTAKLSEVGLTFRFLIHKDKEAEKRQRLKLNYSRVDYKSDGSTEFVFGPSSPIREVGGKKVWFLPFLGYNLTEVRKSFGDGSAVPANAAAAYEEILEENCVDVKWQKGDILLLDNHAVQHARRPGKSPRRVLVAVSK
ncbi:clavaminate synthase-like protein [Iris pallida]|uniref:Clavaminate synthase-like protein n=1 Tax=Iris pallida TaxID=29817 RepID=A0AAX6E0B6_IRIPA|nr:clavaminate synthase-like protein [Iris pallida]